MIDTSKNLLITGGTSGIGFDFLNTYHEKFENISVTGRDFSKIQSNQRLERVQKVNVDFSKSHIGFDFVSNCDVFSAVVFSAGYVKNNVLKFYNSDVHTDIIHVNLVSQMNLLGELVKSKKIQKGASIVFVTSLLGPKIGMLGCASYAASKAGLEGAIKVFALELARQNIRVNGVAPGMVETPLIEKTAVSSGNLDTDRKKYPLGQKYLEPKEITSVINFLLSPDSTGITGQNIIIDRGYTLL